MRTCANTRLGKQMLHRHALPARIAHRAMAELPARNARRDKAAAVARALVDRDNLADGKIAAQTFERQLQRGFHMSTNRQAKGPRVDLGRQAGEMIAHEKRVIGREQSVVEHAERGFQLRRAAGQQDHRPLLRKLHQASFAIGKGQGDAAASSPAGRTDQGRASSRDKQPPVDHVHPCSRLALCCGDPGSRIS
jgi:hypothetical protein